MMNLLHSKSSIVMNGCFPSLSFYIIVTLNDGLAFQEVLDVSQTFPLYTQNISYLVDALSQGDRKEIHQGR